MVDVNEVLDIIDDLVLEVEDMRESGETDLRTVLHLIRSAYDEISEL